MIRYINGFWKVGSASLFAPRKTSLYAFVCEASWGEEHAITEGCSLTNENVGNLSEISWLQV